MFKKIGRYLYDIGLLLSAFCVIFVFAFLLCIWMPVIFVFSTISYLKISTEEYFTKMIN